MSVVDLFKSYPGENLSINQNINKYRVYKIIKRKTDQLGLFQAFSFSLIEKFVQCGYMEVVDVW